MRETRLSGLTRGTKDLLGPYSTVIGFPLLLGRHTDACHDQTTPLSCIRDDRVLVSGSFARADRATTCPA